MFSVHVHDTMRGAQGCFSIVRWCTASQLAKLYASAHSARCVGDGLIAKLVCDSDGTLNSVCTRKGWPPISYSQVT